ncbi:uncharacterized protein LOC144702234 isoform X2 [Wolffia australiana]
MGKKKMAEERWLEEEEALSLSDLPEIISSEEPCKSPEANDFEFGTLTEDVLAADACMCAADDVFFQGQILPLRPSVSSDGVFLPASRCSSRAESFNRATSSGSFSSSRSSSLSARSSCPSETLSRFPVDSCFRSCPSPKPGFSPRRRKPAANPPPGPGWGVLRLGLIRVPEIDLDKNRRRAHEPNSGVLGPAKKTPPQASKQRRDEKETTWKTIGSRLRCRCSPDDVVVVPRCLTGADPSRTSRSNLSRSWKVMCSSRTFEWLAELPSPKSPAP